MYKLCRTEQSAQRQRQIEEVLLELMSARRYEDITVSDLCQRLDMPRKAFYRYFSGKDGALIGLLDHRLMEYGAHPEVHNGVMKPGFNLDLNWFFSFWLLQKDLLDALNRSGLCGILVERAIRQSWEAQILDFGHDTREYVEMVTTFAVCGMMTMVFHWHQDGYRRTPREMAEMAYQMLGRPLVPGAQL